jgi:hypothetical protein
MIKRKNVRHGFIHVLGLIKQSLSMKSCHIFIEVDHEKIQAPCPGFQSLLIMLHHLSIMSRRFGGQGPDLAVTSCISGEKQNGGAIQLYHNDS